MKKLLCVLLVLLLALPAVSPAETEEEELEFEDIDMDAGAPAGEAVWDFPVALEDMSPEYIILARHLLGREAQGRAEAAPGVRRRAVRDEPGDHG